jgi:molecular chaperone DnaK
MAGRVTAASQDVAIGIDLGTTNSCVAVYADGVAHVIPNGGYLTTPSVIAFAASGRRLVGHPAKRQAITNPDHTIVAMKRLIGRKFDGLSSDPATAHQAGLVEGPHGDVRVQLRDQSFSLPELNAMLLQELRAAAEEQLKHPVKKAVITVPAYFNDNQRQATRDAGAIAGLEVIGIINEPTAAALAYGASVQGERTVIVYDLGGGTFDVSVVKTLPDGVFEVLATGGDTLLGGEDFDARIMAWLIETAKTDQNVDLSTDRMALQRLKFAAEMAKLALSAEERTEISLPFIATRANGEGVHITASLSRDDFGALTQDLVEATIGVCTDVLAASGVTKDGIDDVLLVGGSSRMPAVQAAVTACFGRPPSQRVNPDEAVAIGAAIHAAALSAGNPKVELLDVTPQTLGILTEGAKPYPIIPRNTRLPTTQTMRFSTRAGQKNVDFVVMQGDAKTAKGNELLGKFRMSGFGKDSAQIDVTFAIDTDGIVKVTARDHASGREQSINVTASSGLSKDEISQMTAASHQYLADKKADAVRAGALQEVQKALGLLEKGKSDAMSAIGKSGSGAIVLAKVTAAIDSARGAMEKASVAELEALAAELSKMVKLLRGVT